MFARMALFVLTTFFVASPVFAAASPQLDLEMKIAYGQGRFGALYQRCGSPQDRGVIGGSLTNWRIETMRGYHGNLIERTEVLAAFDQAATSVQQDTNACADWTRKASTTWAAVTRLSQNGNDAYQRVSGGNSL